MGEIRRVKVAVAVVEGIQDQGRCFVEIARQQEPSHEVDNRRLIASILSWL